MKNSSNPWSKQQEKVYSTIDKDETTRSLNLERVKLLLNYVGSNKRVLDLGCGDGGVCNALHEQENEVVGVDLEGVVEIAKQKYPHLEFISADLSQKFPFADHEFDIIYAYEILEHIPDDKQFLKECHRVLIDGGSLVITTPNKFYIRNRFYELFGKDWRDPIRDIDTHIHFYSFKTIKKLLDYCVFSIICSKGIEYLKGGIFFWLERILPKTFKNGIFVIAIKSQGD
ncbi:Ubiquinone biosynthesis O-methyltransferase [subsurface metagenome]